MWYLMWRICFQGASPDVLYYFKVYSYGKNDKPSEASNVATLSIETEAEEPESERESLQI